MPGGRPTKYSKKVIEIGKDYTENYADQGDVMPSIAGLACHLGLSRETLHAWKKDPTKQEFSDMLTALLAKQEKILFNMGLSGQFNAAITKLALTKHGYTDKQDTTSGGEKIANTWHLHPVTTAKDG